ncbi:hypothetical protein ABMY35_01160 [Pseudoalteromonas sp. BZB3]|uniref:hypothetical protein n=1 Tax=Pseudoalteromonas sp. BZB3 TaxID=3136670 RepID=UPI0032C463CF
MQNVFNNLKRCKALKEQAEQCNAFQIDKKLKLADEAVTLSFEVIEEIANAVSGIQKQLGVQNETA